MAYNLVMEDILTPNQLDILGLNQEEQADYYQHMYGIMHQYTSDKTNNQIEIETHLDNIEGYRISVSQLTDNNQIQ